MVPSRPPVKFVPSRPPVKFVPSRRPVKFVTIRNWLDPRSVDVPLPLSFREFLNGVPRQSQWFYWEPKAVGHMESGVRVFDANTYSRYLAAVAAHGAIPLWDVNDSVTTGTVSQQHVCMPQSTCDPGAFSLSSVISRSDSGSRYTGTTYSYVSSGGTFSD
jgi:hypothetical protein